MEYFFEIEQYVDANTNHRFFENVDVHEQLTQLTKFVIFYASVSQSKLASHVRQKTSIAIAGRV